MQIMPEKFKLSRSRIQKLIISGAVSDLNGNLLTDPAFKPQRGLLVSVVLPQPEAVDILPEDVQLNVVYEDIDLLVVNKAAGMIVHPSAGIKTGTLVNALLFYCGNSLSGINGVKRPGIVHRLDKDTSGLIVIAKNDQTHYGLANQFAKRTVERKYLAIIHGFLSRAEKRLNKLPGIIFEPNGRIKISSLIGRDKFDRKKMAVQENSGRNAVTRILVKKKYGPIEAPVASLVECKLETGRTHQIRVHLSFLGHSIVGDQIYRASKKAREFHNGKGNFDIVKNFNRQALHAATLGFFHPRTNEWLSFSSKMPDDIMQLQKILENLGCSY